jgi:2-oxoisovalerate dehydrogenase E1 component
MPKSQFVDPVKMRASGTLTFTDIPMNQYKKGIKEERSNYSDEELLHIYSDMLTIRQFELMLNSVKKQGVYCGHEFTYPGPAHLSMGEESVAVGQAYLLNKDDFILGNHRSHHEIIAKAFSAIRKLTDAELMTIMQDFSDGKLLKAVEKSAGSTQTLAEDFFLYGAMCELFAKDNGFSHGLGGSMHAFFLPFGIYPNNAIVGASAPIGVGVALFKKCNRKKGIVVANQGDGAVGCGPVWEALNFASMDQFNQLWEKDYRGGLPIIFNFTNNSYGMGGQTCGETMAYRELVRIGAGISPTQLHAERIDGFNPLAVIDAYRRKKELIARGEGPCLLDVISYRFGGHSPSDASSYRTQEEVEEWEKYDPLLTFADQLVAAGVATKEKVEQLQQAAHKQIEDMFQLAIDPEVSPHVDFDRHPDFVEKLMFSNGHVEKMEERPCEVLTEREQNPRVRQIAKKARFALDRDGNPLPKMRVYDMRDGIFEAVLDKFYTDPTLISYGEDLRDWGGAFAVYRGLTESLPYHRLFNSPISESAMIGAGVGYGIAGGRAIVELMYCDFIGRAGDEIFNQLAKWQSMSAGGLRMPVVVRVSVGAKYGAQHSQDWSSLVAHIPGLKVVFPATPYDAKGLMNAALMGTDPVIFFESQRVYDMGEFFHAGGVPEGYYEVPLGEPDIKRAGSDITILNIGATLYRAIEAADMLEEQYHLSTEIIDARSLVPFDYEPVIASVRKTGRIVLLSDACLRGSFLNDMAANITQLAFDYLDAPPTIVGAKNWISLAHEYDHEFFPQPEWILDAIDQKILPLPGYKPGTDFSDTGQIRRGRLGV